MNDRAQPADADDPYQPGPVVQAADSKAAKPLLDESKPVPFPAEESKDGAQTKISAWKVQ